MRYEVGEDGNLTIVDDNEDVAEEFLDKKPLYTGGGSGDSEPPQQDVPPRQSNLPQLLSTAIDVLARVSRVLLWASGICLVAVLVNVLFFDETAIPLLDLVDRLVERVVAKQPWEPFVVLTQRVLILGHNLFLVGRDLLGAAFGLFFRLMAALFDLFLSLVEGLFGFVLDLLMGAL